MGKRFKYKIKLTPDEKQSFIYLRLLFSDELIIETTTINNKEYKYLKGKIKRKNKFEQFKLTYPKEYLEIMEQRNKFNKDSNFINYFSVQSNLSCSTIRKYLKLQ